MYVRRCDNVLHDLFSAFTLSVFLLIYSVLRICEAIIHKVESNSRERCGHSDSKYLGLYGMYSMRVNRHSLVYNDLLIADLAQCDWLWVDDEPILLSVRSLFSRRHVEVFVLAVLGGSEELQEVKGGMEWRSSSVDHG